MVDMAEMAERDGDLVPVVTETAMGLTLVLLLVLVLLLLLVVMIAATTTATVAAAVLLGGKPYTIPPLDAPTWIALWHPASATRPVPMSRPKSA